MSNYDYDDYYVGTINTVEDDGYFGDMDDDTVDFELDGLDEEEFIDIELEMEVLYEAGLL
tara:strand:+ start:62 stop:241 length:180 start_codon:yes stop_codon:yes gene_type:complete